MLFDEVFDVIVWTGSYFPEWQGRYAGVDGQAEQAYQISSWLPHWAGDDGREYLTDRISRHAAEFVRRHAPQAFFLYASYNAPHSPWQAHVRYREKLAHIRPEPRRIYAAMVAAVDDGIGELMQAVREAGLDGGRTVVAFISDNGQKERGNPGGACLSHA